MAIRSSWSATKQNPDEWGASHRIYGPETGVPGARDPALTPYMIPFGRGIAAGDYRRVVMVTAAQSGKTETLLDVIGERLDNRPAPLIYVGPSKEFLTDQFEPRLVGLLSQSESLLAKVIGGLDGKRQKKTLKRIAGVTLRLAHAGSSTALKSSSAAQALVDEYDEMLKNVKGQGDPLGLIEARGETYADFSTAVVSTPSQGMVETEIDTVSGLEFWSIGEEEDITSPIWRLWQSGTRHHWCWPCPHCRQFFVPRFKQLRYPKNATPLQARREAWLECPRCGGKIEDRHKLAMNQRGVYVAPGQTVSRNGNVEGEAPESNTLSLWVSGLCSPFRTFGERAEIYLTALATNEQAKIQTALNAGFGELFVPGGGDVPEWQEISRRAESYPRKTVPEGVRFIVAGLDVQGNRIPYVVRGFGAHAESWLLDHGELWGRTSETKVWEDLSVMLSQTFDGMPIKLAFIDAGFRPGKKENLPVHRVYEFCRKHKRFVVPTRGSSTPMQRPLIMTAVEVEAADGKGAKYGLQRARLDSDYFKALVHERLGFQSGDPGAFHLHADITEDYCQQLVAEARVKGPSGKHLWVPRAKDNHFLDCEALAAAAAYRIGAESIRAVKPRPRPAPAIPARTPAASPPPSPDEEDDDLPPAPKRPAPQAREMRNRFSSFAERLNR